MNLESMRRSARPSNLDREFTYPRRKCLARTFNRLSRQIFILFHHRHPRQNLVGRNYPIHRNGMTAAGWANQTQRPRSTRASHYQDIVSIKNLRASKAITLLIERLPFPIAIEPLQNLELLGVREFDGRKQGHRDGAWQAPEDSTRNRTVNNIMANQNNSATSDQQSRKT